MTPIRRFCQPLACTAGVHYAPPPRNPPGPIAAVCPSCGKPIYFYGLTAHGILTHPVLSVPDFPRVLGPIALLRA